MEVTEYAPGERPITGITVDGFEDRYFDRVQRWLESLGCRFMRDSMRQGVYHIWLPEGSMECTPLGQSTQWRYVTEVILPNNQVIKKYRITSLQSGITITTFGVPNGII